MDDRWLASSAVLAVLARIGLIVYATGMTRSKNAAGIVFRNIADVCVATLAVWLVGTALWSHSHSVIGFNRHDALGGSAVGLLLLITTLLPGTGAVAAAAGERSRLLPLCAVSAVLAGV
ncbi:MAG TPA: hypothetical protein VK324_08645, partial [Tepidisphaeraceae bacterium]|nr:hypothetical protein [Tepidisphaeraceae bacterium]